MRKRIFILLLTFISLPTFGGELRVVKNKYDADVILYVTTHKYEADLIAAIQEHGSYARGRDHIFFFVKYQTQHVKKVFFTKNKYEANVRVYYSDCCDWGWQKPNPYIGRLH